MDHWRRLVMLLAGFVVCGCNNPVASGPSAAALNAKRGVANISGVLRSPGTSASPSATVGEWVIDLPRDTTGNITAFAVDVSDRMDQAKALEGKQVKATIKLPTQADAEAGANAAKLVSLEAK